MLPWRPVAGGRRPATRPTSRRPGSMHVPRHVHQARSPDTFPGTYPGTTRRMGGERAQETRLGGVGGVHRAGGCDEAVIGVREEE